MTSSTHEQIISERNQVDALKYLQPLACSLVHPSSVQLIKKVESSIAIKTIGSNVSSSVEDPNFG